MIPFLTMFAEFLIKHGDIVNAVIEAVEGGADKATLMANIRASMVAASDVEMAEELKP